MSAYDRLERRLSQAVDRFERVEARLAAASDGAEIVKLGQEHAELKPLVEAGAAVRAARAEMSSLEGMSKDGDREMAELAEAELKELRERLPALEQNALLLLAPKERDESASAILEIRAGTGGEEAALFAGDLLRMYQKYASKRGRKFELEDISDTGIGGVKEAVAGVTGKGVFGHEVYEKTYVLPQDIDPNKLWLLEEGHCFRSQIVNLCELRKISRESSHFDYEAGSIETLRRMVEMKDGITIIPELATLDMPLKQTQLIRHFKKPPPMREVSLVVHRNFVKKKLIDVLWQEILHTVPVKIRKNKTPNVVPV